MDNRRVVLFIVLSVLIVAGWQYLFPPPHPRLPPPAAAPQAAGAAAPGSPGAGGGAASAAGGTAAGSAASPAAGPAPGAPGGAAAAPVPAPAAPPVAGEREEQVVLTAGGTRATFTNRGGQLISLLAAEPGTENVELVRKRAGGPFPFALVDTALRPLPLDEALFAVETGGGGRAVTFRYRGPAGSAEKTFRFDEHGLLAVEVKASGSWALLLGPGIGNPTDAELDSRYGQRDAVLKVDGDVKTIAAKGANEAQVIPAKGLSWAGLEDTFFVTVAVPRGGSVARVLLQPMLVEQQAAGAKFAPVPAKDEQTKEQKDLSHELALVLEPAAGALTLDCYLGAKKFEKLKALPYGLEETVQLGRFGIVVRPLLAGLRWIYEHIVPNYGWAIILMTVLIKVVLLPLTHQSTMSMRKTQALNPRMQAIRERYRPKLKDKQGRPNLEMQRKMNEEVMALYKAEGVNPAGGCLPLLIQMPILFAFYRMLSTSVELRHAPWIFWVHDLSVADPYYILPVVMGLTQFLQVLLGPQAGDPAQRRLFLLMPLLMFFFFLSAPSGLVLYWLTNNVLTIAQQAVYNRFWKLEGQQ